MNSGCEQKICLRAKARSADFVFEVPVELDPRGFISALDKCSNRYWRWGGRGLCLGAEKKSKPEKCL
jgi:hypothetical protein